MSQQPYVDLFNAEDDAGSEHNDEDEDEDADEDADEEVFEVEKVLSICYGDPNRKDEQGLYFKVLRIAKLLCVCSCS